MKFLGNSIPCGFFLKENIISLKHGAKLFFKQITNLASTGNISKMIKKKGLTDITVDGKLDFNW